MHGEPTCPRCGEQVRPPGNWSSDWTCPRHGAVDPLRPATLPTPELLRDLAERSRVPIWLPWPLPDGWLMTGIRTAGDERTGARAIAVACSGPAPLGGFGELVLVAETPGVGLGAGIAGLDGRDPGAGVTDGVPDAKPWVDGHPAPMWSVGAADDRAVFVGEALGQWLWAVLWPGAAGYLVDEALTIVDLRDPAMERDVPVGALCPRLVVGPLP